MRIFGGDNIKRLMERLGMEEGEVIEHKFVNKSIENAQRKVEGHNFDIRKHLLEYDNVMNDQRKAIYQLRRQVIAANAEQTREMYLDLIDSAIVNLVGRCCPLKVHFDEWEIDSLEEITREELENRLYTRAENLFKEKEELYTHDALYSVARIIYLQTIDALWKDHLRSMDNLREGISLRGYAQKDPKQEYKKEGYNLFATMHGAIGGDVLVKASRVVITTETQEDYEARLEARRTKQQKLMTRGPAKKEAQKPQTVKRQGAKVGRNDPCPCGSGKKYKKCHGVSDALNP
jgi:preprotein translocase subunit SecA